MKTCKEIYRLVIEAQDRKLSLVERVSVRVHLMMCSACRRFDTQMGFLRQAMLRFPGDQMDSPRKTRRSP